MLQVPKLTIIMPVYNTAQYLPRAFDALLKQVNKAFKLIVVDDGSTDNSVEVAQSYASRFPYFKLIQKENGGPSDARNVGIKYIDTPYVTFHDGDDWVDPGYTAFFINAFEEHPNVNLVSCGYWIDYPDKKERVVGHPEGDQGAHVRTGQGDGGESAADRLGHRGCPRRSWRRWPGPVVAKTAVPDWRTHGAAARRWVSGRCWRRCWGWGWPVRCLPWRCSRR